MDEKPENLPHTARPLRQISVGRTIFVALMACIGALVFGVGTVPVLTFIRQKTIGEGLPQSSSVPISIFASVLLGIIVGGVLATVILNSFSRLG